MPIHDQGYRRYGGLRRVGGVWWVIARAQVLSSLRLRRFWWLLLAAWLPFLVRAVQIYLASNVPQARFLAASPQTFRDFLGQQSIFVFLVTIALAGVIADDRRANALQLYLSKPLSRIDYVTGKLVALLAFLTFVTLVPAAVLLALQVLFAGSTAFVTGNLFLVPAIVLFSLTQSLVAALAILALSSLSRSRRFVSVLYAGIVFFSAAMVQALRVITLSDLWAVLSPASVLDVIGDAIFRAPGTPIVPVPLAIGSVAALVVLSIVTLERRIRAVEVVS
jgi:ABC-2 type transport system permease protein